MYSAKEEAKNLICTLMVTITDFLIDLILYVFSGCDSETFNFIQFDWNQL